MRQSLKLGPINQAFPDNPVPWRDRVNTLLVNMCNSYMLKLRHIWPYVKSTLIFLEALKGMSPMFLPLLGFPYLFLPPPPSEATPGASVLKASAGISKGVFHTDSSKPFSDTVTPRLCSLTRLIQRFPARWLVHVFTMELRVFL